VPTARLHVTDSPANAAPFRLIDDVEFGEDVTVWSFSNLYGCRIGSHTRIGSSWSPAGASIGAACKISSHSFICDGAEIEDEVFIGHGVLFVNDRVPRATTDEGAPKSDADWTLLRTVVERGASLGSGVIVLGGVRIGARALVGAGAVVTREILRPITSTRMPSLRR
jgi:UDP-2-acetamido-3-amino-2,3-dideoxy-glucuronate N-acetyltransferase